MIVLTLRTDKPEAEVGLYQDAVRLNYHTWQAHRELAETLHARMRDVLTQSHIKLEDIEGIIVYEGPGSFTGLRIGISVANTLAYSLDIPIVGRSTETWIRHGLASLASDRSKVPVVPAYGTPVHITAQRK